MNEGRVPSPEFNSSLYERPGKKWVCGHAAEGCPCRIGPSPDGRCRATAECSPRLALKPGETKGTWVCTRPADWGGPCASGPLPDGRCCRAIIPCKPVRSIRERRGLVTCGFVAACVGSLLVGLSDPMRDAFVNPRPLSRQHSGGEFAHLAAAAGGGRGCVLCHPGANDSFGELLVGAANASRGSLRPSELVSRHPRDLSRIDQSCLACHAAHGLHQADVARKPSCSECHREHLGAGPMAAVAGRSCTDCHGDAAQMLAARQMSRTMPAALFERGIPPGVVTHAALRPVDGYTEVITSFPVDHPEFRVLREKSPDTNTLKFNHRLHLTGSDIPLVNGRPLDCAYCHRPSASGAFMARISFERDCRACHALNFDEHSPGMSLPHGDAAFVRAYLRSLPVQYADYASRTLGIRGTRDIDAFVQRRMQDLRARAHTGENLERAVFLSDGRTGPAPGVAGGGGVARAKFAGCAYCHEVAWREDAAPIVTPPDAPDRWLPGANFNHAKHPSVSCSQCHAAAQSERTSDVILPTQQSCAKCHSPKGGAPEGCTSCHVYHNHPAGQKPAGALTASLP